MDEDPLRLSGRRFMNKIYYYLIKDLDPEGRDKMDAELDMIQANAEHNRGFQRTEPSSGNESDKEEVIGTGGTSWKNWTPPPGWTPPGWVSDETAQASAFALMNQQAGGFR